MMNTCVEKLLLDALRRNCRCLFPGAQFGLRQIACHRQFVKFDYEKENSTHERFSRPAMGGIAVMNW